jgi:acyl-CoA synthetase (AMP-forming)/AMP-acid ligase II
VLRGVLTVGGILERTARWYGPRPAVADGARTLTYAELNDLARRMAHALAARGVARGDRVAFLSPSTIELCAAFHAAHKLGAVTLNLHGREAVGQHVAVARAVGVRLLLFAEVYAAAAAAIAAALDPDVIAMPLGEAGGPGLVQEAAGHEARALGVAMDETDPATILLSSGTTGLPKALLHTQRDVLTSCHGLMGTWSGIAPDDVFLNAFSPSFAVWLGHPTAFLNHGACVVLLGQWDPGRFLELIARHRVTCTALTASMWKAVLRQPVEAHDLASLRLAYWLGERMARERVEEVMARVTPHLGCLYGLAEFIGGTGLTMIRAGELRAGKWASIGRPYLNTDLRIVGAGGPPDRELPPGESGEILLRGATLAEASLTDPAWRSRRVRDGWLHTGDIGHRDADGYVYLDSRADFMINSAGVKFAPEEIEAVLERHPDVAEAGVLGVRDEERGQRVRAVVVAKDPALAVEALEAWCRSQPALAAFKRPREYRFAAALPRTVTGKLDRAALGREAGDEP